MQLSNQGRKDNKWTDIRNNNYKEVVRWLAEESEVNLFVQKQTSDCWQQLITAVMIQMLWLRGLWDNSDYLYVNSILPDACLGHVFFY